MRYKWTALPILASIKNMDSSMARRYPSVCEITDGRGNAITDYDPANDNGDDTDSNYDPS